MRVWRGEEARCIRLDDRPVFALGFFDGVHRGHQALVRRAVADARECGTLSGVVTFDPHPLSVLRPERAVDLLTTVDEREELLARLGVEALVVYPFSRSLADLPPEVFVSEVLERQLGAAEVVVGYNFTFGAGRTGHQGLLRRLGAAHGFRTVVIPPVRIRGEVVSSSAVREKLLAGRVEEACRMLGYAYFLEGPVGRGEGRGERLGFPTANLEPPPGKLVPQDGVYVTGVRLPGAAEERPAVAAVGTAPTFASARRLVEVHIPGYAGDLYGVRLRVSFHQRLRGMVRFPSPAALQAQVAEDARRAAERWVSVKLP